MHSMLFADGDACGDGGHQDNDMLTLDHWLDIVAENHLAIELYSGVTT